MGVGHLAVGFASKKLAPRTSLAWLILAPVFVDLLWGVFILTGIERARITPGVTKAVPLDLEYIPFSHSLVASVGWAALLAGIYFATQKNLRVAAVLFAGVLSHWFLDFVSHAPDMPIGFHGPHVGLALWDYPQAAFSVEAAMLALGFWLYVSSTRPKEGGKIGLVILMLALFAFNVAVYNVPPPPTVTPLALGNLALILVVWVCYRIDRRREAVI